MRFLCYNALVFVARPVFREPGDSLFMGGLPLFGDVAQMGLTGVSISGIVARYLIRG